MGVAENGVTALGPKDAQRFKNKRAELYWSLREALEQGKCSLPADDELIADLSAVRYEFAQDGKIKLESKDDTRKRLGRSPDRADALVLALTSLTDRRHIIETVIGSVTMENYWRQAG